MLGWVAGKLTRRPDEVSLELPKMVEVLGRPHEGERERSPRLDLTRGGLARIPQDPKSAVVVAVVQSDG